MTRCTDPTDRRAPDWLVSEHHSQEGMNKFLDSLQSLLMCISQRRMSEEQLDRYARLLNEAENDALRRARRRRRAA